MTKRLTFEEAAHVYQFDGKAVPSVTQAMKPITKLWTSGDQLEWARQQGKAIHAMVEYDCKGTLDVETLPDWLKPFYADWRKFITETGFQLIASEPKLYHEVLRYAGTPDLIGRMTKLKPNYGGVAPPPVAVIDLKRTIPKSTGVQTAAYMTAWNELIRTPVITQRYGLSLCPYRLVPFTNKGDFNVFLSCLTITNYLETMK